MTSRTISKRLLTFDAWETLFHAERPIHETYQYYAKLHGHMFCEVQDIEHRLPMVMKEQRSVAPLFGCKKSYGFQEKSEATEHWWGNVVRDVFAPRHCSEELVRDILRHFSSGTAYSLRTGTKEVLESLEKQGIMLGILSNFDIRIFSVLQDLGILHHFSFVKLSIDCGQEKPSHAIFESAIDSAQEKLSRGEILGGKYHVGNDWKRDALGAYRAGWNSIYLDEAVIARPQITMPADAIRRISSLSQLQSIFM